MTSRVGAADSTIVYHQLSAVNQTETKSEVKTEPTQNNKLIPLKDLQDYSIQAFDCFTPNWTFNKFWIRGNTCHACIGFVKSFTKHFSDHPKSAEMQAFIQTMLQQNADLYNSLNKPNDYDGRSDLDTMWDDDFAWWGIMAVDAHHYLTELKNTDLAKQYLDIACKCWDRMNKNSYDNTDNAKPVPRGCRNNAALELNMGVKNTVVNAGLMFLSAKLYQATGDKSYLDMTKSQWLWFSQWFALNNGYLKTFSKDTALIGERPLADGIDYSDKTHPDYNDGWTWTGDHGMLFGVLPLLLDLKDKLSFGPNFEIEVKALLYKLGRGVKAAGIGDEDGLFHEFPCYPSWNKFPNDYLGGRGFEVRNLRSKETMHLLGVDFTENIFKTIQAIWAKYQKDKQFPAEYATDEQNTKYFAQFKNLIGFADVVNWNFDMTSDPNLVNAASIAMFFDFMNAALTAYEPDNVHEDL